MSEELPHDEVQELLPAAALEMLETAEMARLGAHLAVCAGCAELLAQYRDAAAGLALGIPADAMGPARSAVIRNRLLTRVRAARGPNRVERLGVDRWLGWMVAAGLSGLLLVHHSVHRTVAYGWLLAGVLTFVLIGFAIHALRQQRRVSELQQRLEEATFRRHPPS